MARIYVKENNQSKTQALPPPPGRPTSKLYTEDEVQSLVQNAVLHGMQDCTTWKEYWNKIKKK